MLKYFNTPDGYDDMGNLLGLPSPNKKKKVEWYLANKPNLERLISMYHQDRGNPFLTYDEAFMAEYKSLQEQYPNQFKIIMKTNGKSYGF